MTQVAGRAAAIMGLLSLTSRGHAQLLGPGGTTGPTDCSFADFTARTTAVDNICCDSANAASDKCHNGVPTLCDEACGAVYVPWFGETRAVLSFRLTPLCLYMAFL